MWIKICGTTSLEDALVAIDAGADALGFIFAESPRRVTVEEASAILDKLPSGIETVGVFLDEPAEQIRSIAQSIGLSAVQVYGSDVLENWTKMNGTRGKKRPKLILSVSGDEIAENGYSVKEVERKSVFAVLVDAIAEGGRGGTGTPFDWARAQKKVEELSMESPIIVAGGLRPDNVARAVKLFQPWGVDVCSGVEAERRRKDPAKIRAFVAAARGAAQRH